MELIAKPVHTTYAIHIGTPLAKLSAAYRALDQAAFDGRVRIGQLSILRAAHGADVTFVVLPEDDTDETHELIRQIIREAISVPA